MYHSQRNKRRVTPLRLAKRMIEKDPTRGDFAIKPYPAGKNIFGRRKDRNICPLVVLINPKSGGQIGEDLMQRICRVLTPYQVFDLRKGGPSVGLNKFLDPTNKQRFINCRILVCGGDGTVGWVLEELDKMDCENTPPLGVLPLGTGNDLARTIGWGGGFDKSDDLLTFLADLKQSSVVYMDRWKVTIRQDGQPDKEKLMNNYFSIGIDAAIAQKFHDKREQNPALFSSRTGNKMLYALWGLEKAIMPSTSIHDKVSGISVKNLPVDDNGRLGSFTSAPANHVQMQRDWEGIVISNLPNYQAGNNFWGVPDPEKEAFKPMNISDGLIEVMAVGGSLHIAAIHSELYDAHRLAQCNYIQLQVRDEIHMQVDGEPWIQKGPCTITITHYKRSPMLMKSGRSPQLGAKEVESETEDDTETESELLPMHANYMNRSTSPTKRRGK